MGQVMADASQDQLGKPAASTSTCHYEVRLLVIGGVHDHRRGLTNDDEDTVLGLRGAERRTPLGKSSLCSASRHASNSCWGTIGRGNPKPDAAGYPRGG